MKKIPEKLMLLEDNEGHFFKKSSLSSSEVFQMVNYQIIKTKENQNIRVKPKVYQLLQQTLKQKLQAKTALQDEETRNQIIMLQKCKNYHQIRRKKYKIHQQRKSFATLYTNIKPNTAIPHQRGKVNFQMNNLMIECDKENNDITAIRKNVHLFEYYCQKMNRRMQAVHKFMKKSSQF